MHGAARPQSAMPSMATAPREQSRQAHAEKPAAMVPTSILGRPGVQMGRHTHLSPFMVNALMKCRADCIIGVCRQGV